MNFLKIYWLLILLGLWFFYKWWNAKRILRLIPQLKKEGAIFLDVRSSDEFNAQHAPETINIPLPELTKRLSELQKTSPIIVCCASGSRSAVALMTLKRSGYSTVYNIGSWTKFLDLEQKLK